MGQSQSLTRGLLILIMLWQGKCCGDSSSSNGSGNISNCGVSFHFAPFHSHSLFIRPLTFRVCLSLCTSSRTTLTTTQQIDPATCQLNYPPGHGHGGTSMYCCWWWWLCHSGCHFTYDNFFPAPIPVAMMVMMMMTEDNLFTFGTFGLEKRWRDRERLTELLWQFSFSESFRERNVEPTWISFLSRKNQFFFGKEEKSGKEDSRIFIATYATYEEMPEISSVSFAISESPSVVVRETHQIIRQIFIVLVSLSFGSISTVPPPPGQ